MTEFLSDLLKDGEENLVLGWRERIVFARLIKEPPERFACADGMKRPKWWQFWLKRKWLLKVEQTKHDFAWLLEHSKEYYDEY